MNFCRNIHFFASEEEVEQWAAGRGDIETLSLDEAFDLGYQLWPEAYSYAKTLAQAASPIDPASGPKWAAPEALVRPN